MNTLWCVSHYVLEEPTACPALALYPTLEQAKAGARKLIAENYDVSEDTFGPDDIATEAFKAVDSLSAGAVHVDMSDCGLWVFPVHAPASEALAVLREAVQSDELQWRYELVILARALAVLNKADAA